MKLWGGLSAIFIAVSLWSGESIALVKNVKGKVLIQQGNTYKAVEKGGSLSIGDLLKTSEKSSVGIVFKDGTVISLGSNTVFVVNMYRFKPASNDYAFEVNLSKGKAAVETGKIGTLAPQNVSFKVPQGAVGVRGTKFIVDVAE